MTQSSLLTLDQNIGHFLRLANKTPVLTVEQETTLAHRYRDENDIEAARKLVLSHLRHVIHVARGFSGYGLPLADLIQEGNVGLMKAVKNFDPDRGIRLVSYAVHWIKAEIYDYVLKNWKIVKVATTKAQRKLFFNLRKSRKTLKTLTESEIHELASDLDIPAKVVREMEQRMGACDVSFDGDHDDDSPAAPCNYLPDMRYNPERLAIAAQTENDNRSRLRVALATLSERSRDIVTQRWLQNEKATLHDLSVQHNVSAERIRQIEKRAMQDIRKKMTAPNH